MLWREVVGGGKSGGKVGKGEVGMGMGGEGGGLGEPRVQRFQSRRTVRRLGSEESCVTGLNRGGGGF